MNQFQLNWFDIVAVIILLVGMSQGRKRGMSQEWLVTLQWIITVAIAPYIYRPLGDWLAKTAPMNRVVWYVCVYLATAILVKILCGQLKRFLPEKYAGPSDAFGSAEYYLGMLAGIVRYGCILMAALAILHAPNYTAQDIAAAKAFDEKNYGSSFFPRFSSIQQDVFKSSFVGSLVHQRAEVLLIAKNDVKPKKKKENLH